MTCKLFFKEIQGDLVAAISVCDSAQHIAADTTTAEQDKLTLHSLLLDKKIQQKIFTEVFTVRDVKYSLLWYLLRDHLK